MITIFFPYFTWINGNFFFIMASGNCSLYKFCFFTLNLQVTLLKFLALLVHLTEIPKEEIYLHVECVLQGSIALKNPSMRQVTVVLASIVQPTSQMESQVCVLAHMAPYRNLVQRVLSLMSQEEGLWRIVLSVLLVITVQQDLRHPLSVKLVITVLQGQVTLSLVLWEHLIITVELIIWRTAQTVPLAGKLHIIISICIT